MAGTIRKKMTWNSLLDGQKPGDVFVDENGDLAEVVAVFGPKLSEQALRRLRRAAFRLSREAD